MYIPVCTSKFKEKQKLNWRITTGFEPITSCIVCGIAYHCATSVKTLVMWNVQRRYIYIVLIHFCKRHGCVLCYTCEYRVCTRMYLYVQVCTGTYPCIQAHYCMYRYIQVYTGTYWYVQVCTDTYGYVPVHTSMYQYVPVHTVMYRYVLFYTGMYRYIRVCTGIYPQKQKYNI